MESFVPVCPRASNPVPPRPNAPRIKAQDRKWVTLEWDRVPADSDIKYFVIEKQEEFLVPKVPEEEEEKENADQEEGDNREESLKPRPVLRTGPSFTGEFQEYCSNWMVAMMTDDNDNTAKIADLGEGSKYKFRIKAVNAGGQSEPSDPTGEVNCRGKQRPVIDRRSFAPISVSLGENITMQVLVKAVFCRTYEYDVQAPNCLLQVKFSGDPVPERKWFYGKVEILPSHPGVTLENKDHLSRLTLSNAKREDIGQYEFRVENEFGQETGLIDVSVRTEPDRPRGPMRIEDIYAEGMMKPIPLFPLHSDT